MNPARQSQREARSVAPEVVPGVAPVPGIGAAMVLSPALGAHLQGLAEALLVEGLPGSGLTRFECELVATAVSAANDCFYCMDSHACFAAEHAARAGDEAAATLDEVKAGRTGSLDCRLAALVDVALCVRALDVEAERQAVAAALDAGAEPVDVHHVVAIAAAFSMYNRLVEGLGAETPADPSAYRARAAHIADHGYRSTARA
jgi:AhpD family alkylhydroperoxidase